jgi:hypothetical protein
MKMENMSIEELIGSFETLCLEQYKADMTFDMPRYNKAFNDMIAVSDELRGRSGDQRRDLATLYTHPNEQVRLKAAIHTLAVLPDEAQAILQKLIDDRIHPQAADAIGILRAFREGTYIPT